MSFAENKAVFLSYASQDAEAARRICEALRAAGVEVWFDQSELVGGDAWDQKIRRQIKECALFVPVISARTQARREGYFRLEWKLAAQRTHTMADGTPFLLPVVIDDTSDRDALVPEEFRAVQWMRLDVKATPESLARRVARLLGPDAGAGAAAHRAAGGDSTPAKRRRSWSRPALAIAGVIALGLALFFGPLARRRGEGGATLPPSSAPARASVSAPFSEAQKLVAQARKIYDEGDELNRENLFLAEELVKRAIALDPAEPAAWELATWVSYTIAWHGIDLSEARRDALARQAARALALAPDSTAARIVHANARLTPAWAGTLTTREKGVQEVERDMLTLAQREPNNWQIQRVLGTVYRFGNRTDESLAALQRALELSGGHPMAAADLVNVFVRRDRHEDAERIVATTLARKPTGRLRAFDVFLKLRWRGDTAAAIAAVESESWPAWLTREDRGAFFVWLAYFWGGKPEEALAVARALPRDYLRDASFAGPRAVLMARAYERAGHSAAAQADWRTVVQVADRELAGSPDELSALYWKAWALARLGDVAGARALCAVIEQRTQNDQPVFLRGTHLSALLAVAGLNDAAIQDLVSFRARFTDGYAITRAVLELDPAYDSLRADPRFQAIVREAPAPPPDSKLQNPNAEPRRAAVDARSVAVLAFENLSDDKTNEYFSEGISEELLNVLAKIPELKVSARTSAFSFKGKNVPIPEIARQLGVAYVVEGSVRKAGSEVRITAQLIKAADGFHVWSETFKRELKDIFAVQDEIARLVSQNISPLLPRARAVSSPPVDPEAFQAYLAGRALATKAGMDNLREAVALFGKAVQLNPGYTAASVQQARAYVQLGRWGGLVPQQAWAAAKAALAPALAAAPDAPDVLVAQGWILRTADWKWREAERAFRRAVEQRPNDPDVLTSAAVLLLNIGKSDEANRLVQRALEIDPLNPATQFDLGMIYRFSGRSDAAERQFRRALELSAQGQRYRAFLSITLAKLGRLDEAEALARAEPDELSRDFALGLAAAARGNHDGVREILRRLERNRASMGQLADFSAYVASLRAALGELDAGIAELAVAREARDPSIAWVKVNHLLSPLYAHPDWPVFLRSVGLADEQLK